LTFIFSFVQGIFLFTLLFICYVIR
jgi:hypothetical protein